MTEPARRELSQPRGFGGFLGALLALTSSRMTPSGDSRMAEGESWDVASYGGGHSEAEAQPAAPHGDYHTVPRRLTQFASR